MATAQPQDNQDLTPGMYVVFQIDMDALAGYYPYAVETLGTYTSHKFIGLVLDVHERPYYGDELQVDVLFVSGIPPPGTILRADCMTIAPSRVGGALETQGPFPWEDVRQWTSLGARLHVTRFTPAGRRCALTPDSWEALKYKADMDRTGIAVMQASGGHADLDDNPLLVLKSSVLPARLWSDVTTASYVEDPRFFAEQVKDIVR